MSKEVCISRKVDLLLKEGWSINNISNYFGCSFQSAKNLWGDVYLRFNRVLPFKRNEVFADDVLTFVSNSNRYKELGKLKECGLYEPTTN